MIDVGATGVARVAGAKSLGATLERERHAKRWKVSTKFLLLKRLEIRSAP